MYPPIDIAEISTFLTIIEDYIDDPSYFDPTECPYDPDIMDKIKKLVQPVMVASATIDEKNPVGRPTKQVVLPIDEVEKEINDIRQELASLKIDGKTLETADRIQIIKTRAALVEKIIGMKERVTNLRTQKQFVTVVIGIMEDMMDQKQREKMIKLLEPYLEQ
jgi:hypothetical protein